MGNVAVELTVDAECDYRNDRQAVYCLDRVYALIESEQLDLLARAVMPVRIRTGSAAGAHAVSMILARRPERWANAEVAVQADPTCTGACERRITLESK